MIIIQKVQIFLIIMIIYKVKLMAGGLLRLLTQEFLIINLMMGLRDLSVVCRLEQEAVADLRF
jgi:hypothetical protein